MKRKSTFLMVVAIAIIIGLGPKVKAQQPTVAPQQNPSGDEAKIDTMRPVNFCLGGGLDVRNGGVIKLGTKIKITDSTHMYIMASVSPVVFGGDVSVKPFKKVNFLYFGAEFDYGFDAKLSSLLAQKADGSNTFKEGQWIANYLAFSPNIQFQFQLGKKKDTELGIILSPFIFGSWYWTRSGTWDQHSDGTWYQKSSGWSSWRQWYNIGISFKHTFMKAKKDKGTGVQQGVPPAVVK